MKTLLSTILCAAILPASLFAQATPTAKQVPPPGIALSETDTSELKMAIEALEKQLLGLHASKTSAQTALLPDAEIFLKAAKYALQNDEFFKPQEVTAAKAQLSLGTGRAAALLEGSAPWTSDTGRLVLGYQSRIDGSVQPYGLLVPEDWTPGDKTPRPLYLWFHGRNDTLSEVNFITSCLTAKRNFATPNAFELHLYGRFCNASKFAGEIDAFEALADVQRRYSIDANRIAAMGFSMGGATAWHIGAHHPGLWAVVSSGAGFAETQIYAKIYDAKKITPPWWEEVLYTLYNATDVAANFSNVPLIAYSGELDPQKQSADIMETALAAEGLKLERFIGPKTGHKYEPETKKALSSRVNEFMTKGRDLLPPRVRFQTYTLRYNQAKWITLDALERHWVKADIDAQLVDEGTFQINTKNIAAFTISFPAGPAPLDKTHPPRVLIDGQDLVGPAVREQWTASFRKDDGKWRAAATDDNSESLRKTHGLQGPIDDAFMDSFLFVRPTGRALNEKMGAWARNELELAIRGWRTVFRGDARVKDDTALTPEDVANHNLVLWGDPGSNQVLARILPKLPIQWTKEKVTIGKLSGAAEDHAPVLIYPNPLNPARYVVLNSGFTFRMGARTSNSLQTPKLPDWALIDLRTPPSEQWPGQVVDAGFFDESWRLPQ